MLARATRATHDFLLQAGGRTLEDFRVQPVSRSIPRSSHTPQGDSIIRVGPREPHEPKLLQWFRLSIPDSVFP